jgi:hypothetical protein
VESTAKLERIPGPCWETFTVRQVQERVAELERVSNFAWAVAYSMRERHAPTAGAVLQPNGHQSAQ